MKFLLEVDVKTADEDVPSPIDVLYGIWEALPKEWKDDPNPNHGRWYGLRNLKVVDVDKQQARIVELQEMNDSQREMVRAEWDARAKALVECRVLETTNTDQAIVIARLRNEILDFKTVVSHHKAEIDAWRLDRNGTLDARDELQNRYDDSLKDWVAICNDRDYWRSLHDEADATINRLKQANLNHTMENVGAARMVAKIVDAMKAEGFDIAGWGNDEQLIELEADADAIGSAVTDLKVNLDNIRTER